MPNSGESPEPASMFFSYYACRVPYCFGAHLPDGSLGGGTWSVDTIMCPAGMSHYDTFSPEVPASYPELVRWGYCQSDSVGEACYVWDRDSNAWTANGYGKTRDIPPDREIIVSNPCPGPNLISNPPDECG